MAADPLRPLSLGAVPVAVVELFSLQEAQNIFDAVGAIMDDPITSAVLAPRPIVVNVRSVDSLRESDEMRRLLQEAKDRFGWVVNGRSKLRLLARFDRLLDETFGQVVGTFLRDVHNSAATVDLRLHARRLLDLAVRIDGPEGVVRNLGEAIFGRVIYITDGLRAGRINEAAAAGILGRTAYGVSTRRKRLIVMI